MRGGENRAAVISIPATRSDGAYILSGGHIAKQTEDCGKGKLGLRPQILERIDLIALGRLSLARERGKVRDHFDLSSKTWTGLF